MIDPKIAFIVLLVSFSLSLSLSLSPSLSLSLPPSLLSPVARFPRFCPMIILSLLLTPSSASFVFFLLFCILQAVHFVTMCISAAYIDDSLETTRDEDWFGNGASGTLASYNLFAWVINTAWGVFFILWQDSSNVSFFSFLFSPFLCCSFFF